MSAPFIGAVAGEELEGFAFFGLPLSFAGAAVTGLLAICLLSSAGSPRVSGRIFD
jgi:hypothetical protein